jgi:hypothetical protein
MLTENITSDTIILSDYLLSDNVLSNKIMLSDNMHSDSYNTILSDNMSFIYCKVCNLRHQVTFCYQTTCYLIMFYHVNNDVIR